MTKVATRGTCSLWFEYSVAPSAQPGGANAVADHAKAVVGFATAYGYSTREARWPATTGGSKGAKRVLIVESDLLDGPEMVRRSLPLVPNAINIVSASGDGQPTAGESDALRLIQAMTRGVIPVHYAQ